MIGVAVTRPQQRKSDITITPPSSSRRKILTHERMASRTREAQDEFRKDLKAHLDRLASEKSSMQTERVNLQGDLRIESERREMLQAKDTAR
ncbi:filament-forming protein [Purpureocillium lavendulum]|uniref:Filament-forming protein n=1 Tax=Purpureocillium lavendulum TaxID=1247861 RepID=A0AB34G5D1_9HYPO|nr:filament-forming protein [Purpureocillium lavendulum]